MIGGAYAMREHAGVVRATKDLDIFCLKEDVPRLLHVLRDAGYATEVTYPTWLAKVQSGKGFIDVIFGSSNGLCWVDDLWFLNAREMQLFGLRVGLTPPEETIWSKADVQHRDRFDGSDIAQLIRHRGQSLDWPRLLARFGRDWELLLGHLLTFRFAFPSERDTVPAWVMRELLGRVTAQLAGPPTPGTAPRGWVLSPEYEPDGRGPVA